MTSSFDLSTIVFEDGPCFGYRMFQYEAGMFASMIVGCIQLISVLLFWSLHLRHHLNNPIYRVRHPIFWQICLCIGSIQIILRCIIHYLRIKEYVSIYILQLIKPFITILLSLAFPVARYYPLYTQHIFICT